MHMRVVQAMGRHRARNRLRSGCNVLHDLLSRSRWQRGRSFEEMVSEEVEGMEANATRAADEDESEGGCPERLELAEPVRIF